MIGCGSRAVPGRRSAGPTAGRVGQEQRILGASDHSRYRAGVGKLQFMINGSARESIRSEESVAATDKADEVGHAKS